MPGQPSNFTTVNAESALQINGTEVLNSNVDTLVKVDEVTLGTSTGNAGLLSWANPESSAIIVTRLVVDVTTSASGVTTANFGSATGAAASSDNLIDGVDIGSAAIVADNLENAGTNGKQKQKVPVSQYVTGTASADPASVVGKAYIYYIVT